MARMRTIDGWRRLDELAPGARVAIPRWIPHALDASEMPDAEVILLAHMIGDGSFVKRQPIRYASVDEDNLGLFGLRSYEKFIPARIFALPTNQIAIFLRHLWATDGSIRWDKVGRQARIYYTSTSLRLIHDVADLLLRLGVHGRIRLVQKAGYRDCWHLTIDGGENQTTFLEDIGAHGIRGVLGEECLAQLDTMTFNPNVDTIPKDIWDRVRALLTTRNLSHREFQSAMGTKFCGSTMWKHSPSRDRLARAACILDSPELTMLCTNDIFWDRITEITGLGEQKMFSVSVQGTENLVAQGILVYAGV